MAEARPYNAGDPKHVQSRKEREKLEAKRDAEGVRYVMDHPLGRHFVWSILEDCGLFRSSFTGNNSTFFNEGERNIGLKLMKNRLEAITPKEFLLMWSEHLAQEQSETKADEAVRTESVEERESD